MGVGNGAGRCSAGARARFRPARGSGARGCGGASVHVGLAVPALAAERTVDPPLRLHERSRAECAAAGDPLAARLRKELAECRGAGARRPAEPHRAEALRPLRHGRLVALRAGRRLCLARVREVRHRPARKAREADGRPLLGRGVADVPRVLLRRAAGDAVDPDACDLAEAARRLSRYRADPDQPFDARVGVARRRRQGRDVQARRGLAHAPVEATGRVTAGLLSRAGLRGELRGTSPDRRARAGRRRLGHDAAADHGRELSTAPR